MKKRQRKVRLIRAAVQLAFFIVAPALFSTAFAGIKSIFQAIAAHQPVTWNSFLDVTAALLLAHHDCSDGISADTPAHSVPLGMHCTKLTAVCPPARYSIRKGRHGYPEKAVRILQKVKYIWLLAFILLSILTGWYQQAYRA